MRTVRLGLFAALALILAAGCRTSLTPAKVSGRVTYKGQPVKAGAIAFHAGDQGSFHAALTEDGTYEIGALPAGEMTVTVDTESFNPNKKVPTYGGAGRKAPSMEDRLKAEGLKQPSKEEMSARYTKIPKKYASAETSGLKVTLQKGTQTKDFELKD